MIYRIVFGVLYVLAYVFLAIMFVPFDNFMTWGTFVFLAPVPTIPIIFYALYLSNKLAVSSNERTFVLVLAVHYLVSLLLLAYAFSSSTEVRLTKLMFERYPGSFLFTVAWYLFGQSVIWGLFFKERRNEKF